MSRYTTTPILDTTLPRHYATRIFPVIPTSANDVYIVTTSTERLDKLAVSFYNDATSWWVIAAANGLGKGTLMVPRDTKLRIPDKALIDTTLTQINKTR